MEKNGTPASPATAFASRVLPVPGGPISSTPLGMRAPMSMYALGLRRKSTISLSSSFSSSAPATSANVTLFLFGSWMRARLLPKFITLPLPPVCARIISQNITPQSTSEIASGIKSYHHGVVSG